MRCVPRVGANPLLEEGDGGASVMRDEGQIGEPIQDAAENETGHRDHSIERPAEHLLDIEFDVVIDASTVGIVIRVDPERTILAIHKLKEWQQLRIMQETPARIGVD